MSIQKHWYTVSVFSKTESTNIIIYHSKFIIFCTINLRLKSLWLIKLIFYIYKNDKKIKKYTNEKKKSLIINLC